MVQYVILDRPTDYPDDVIVRRWRIGEGREPVPIEPVWIAASIDAARRAIWQVAPFAVRFPRSPEDKDSIVETWW